ncbi:unnamed protein product [Pedinophyceae sp. YPF-701]|nr:unnamed protein product [Pedinophyceae sp. YPF-701]
MGDQGDPLGPFNRYYSRQRNPTVELRSHDATEGYMDFLLANTEASVANTLRRVILSHVPTIAIELVGIEENTSPLPDEYLAHRLGLVPLVSSAEVHRFHTIYEAEDAEDFPEAELSLALTNTSGENVVVTTNMLKIDQQYPSIRPVGFDESDPSGGIPIVKLAQNQSVRLTAIARKGIGKDHAKFQPVATAVFQYVPDIRINQALFAQLSDEEKQELVDADPNSTLAINAVTGELEVPEPERYAWDEEVLRKSEELGKPGLLTIKAKDQYVFKVESLKQLTCPEIAASAFEVITKKLRGLLAHVEGADVAAQAEDLEMDQS